MQLHASLRARNPQLAARTGAWILGTSAVLCPLTIGVVETTARQQAVLAVAGLLLGAGAAAYLVIAPDRLDRAGAFVVLAVAGAPSVSAMVVSRPEGLAQAPIVLLLAVIWAGVFLRTRAAWLVTAAAGLSFPLPAFALSSPREAAIASLVFVAAAALNTAVLSRALDQQAALTKKLTDIASLDALTGLATRRAFDEAVGIALTGHAEEKGTALVLVDLDRFKTINDVHGHPVGDQALQHVSTILSGSVRARDSVVGRLGGDELAVLLAGCPVDVAERRARDLWEAVRNTPLELADGTTLQLTVSVGVAHALPSGLGAGELYAAADGALYAAKRGGRDTVAVAG